MDRYEALVKINNLNAIENIRNYITNLPNPMVTEYKNDLHVRFEFFGEVMDCVTLMGMEASIVTKIN
jgi:hypothetical protein